MQSRQPLHTSGWMYTVSNSVRMMALVGHTSMQLAIAQCLQTSLIMFHATPPFGVVNSWNCTWRQFWSSSWPVLSKLSRNCGACPGSWFHSLQATSQALQPMHSVTSVKKPTVLAIVGPPSHSHEVRDDLALALLAGVEIERHRPQLVDDRDRCRILPELHRDQVAGAARAGVDPEVGKALGFPEDRQLGLGPLATAGAGHPGVRPGVVTARADQVP